MDKLRILVVEDETLVARDIENMMLSLGYEVVDIVGTGVEAVSKAGELQLDLILIDIILPGEIDGIEAAKRILQYYRR